jgi:hypothetical protein
MEFNAVLPLRVQNNGDVWSTTDKITQFSSEHKPSSVKDSAVGVSKQRYQTRRCVRVRGPVAIYSTSNDSTCRACYEIAHLTKQFVCLAELPPGTCSRVASCPLLYGREFTSYSSTTSPGVAQRGKRIAS